MEYKINTQRGYLLILATVLIIIATFIGSLLVNMFMGKTAATQSSLQSDAALYIAHSGLEIAKRDIAVNYLTCSGIGGLAKYTNAAQFSGVFTVTGTKNLAQSTLQSGIGATDTSIPLASVSNFANNGIALIDNEMVQYVGISGTTLLNAVRGVFGSMAIAHSAGSNAVQDQCLITSTAGVPTLTSPEGKRVIQQALLGRVGFSYGGSIPALVSGSTATLQGSPAVINPSVTSGSSNFPGSTIVSAGAASLGGAAVTEVNDGSGGLVISSSKTGLAADVVQNYSGAAAATLFNIFFSATKAQVQTGAVIISHSISDLTELSGHAGQTVWVDGGIDTNGGNVTIGASSNPVILIVNGDVSLGGNASLTVYGVAYVIGKINTNGGGSLIGFGQIAAEGAIKLQGGGTINFDSSVLAILGLKDITIIRYSGNVVGILQEVFP